VYDHSYTHAPLRREFVEPLQCPDGVLTCEGDDCHCLPWAEYYGHSSKPVVPAQCEDTEHYSCTSCHFTFACLCPEGANEQCLGDSCYCISPIAAQFDEFHHDSDQHDSDHHDFDTWYERSFDGRIPLSTSTGVGLSGGLWKAFEGVMR